MSGERTFTCTTYVALAIILPLALAACGGGGGGTGGGKGTTGPAPTVAAVTPGTGPSGGGTSVTIIGTNFSAGAAVHFGGTAATTVTLASDTQIQATTPSHATGTVDVQVTNSDGQAATLPASFTFGTGAAVISISPTSGSTAGGTVVTVNGSNFISGATVSFGGVAATSVSFISTTQLQAITPARPVGVVSVTVNNPDGTSATLPSAFTYVSSVTLTTASPTAGTTLGGTVVTLTGSGLVSGATVTFGGVASPAVTWISPSQLTAAAPAHAAGTVSITVTNPSTESATLTSVYRYVAPPTVSSITPTSGSIAGGSTVTINGANFVAGATVTFGGVAAPSVTFLSATQLRAVAPAHAAGTATVQVRNPDGQTGVSPTDFTYTSTLGIGGISPVSGPTSGGTTVTINGTSFVATPQVFFGGVPAASVTFISATQITAVTPAHADGVVDVQVVNPDTTSSTLPNAFTFATSLTIGSVSPSSGPDSGGTTVTITGTGFTPTDLISFGGTFAASKTFIDSATVQAVTPAHVAGTFEVRISPASSAGDTLDDAVLPNGFTFLGVLAVTSVTPNSGPLAGGTSVAIVGTNFQPGATVSFGGTPATSATVVSSLQINAVTPAHAAGAVSVDVTNPDLTTATLPGGFTYVAVLSVTGATPNTGPATGGTSVNITGTNFQPGATVSFGGIPATGVIIVSSTQITATTPAHAAGVVDVQVTNPGPTSATLSNGFTYTPVLTVASLNPVSGPSTGGTVVTITGTNFQAGATVLFDTDAATSVSVVSSTQIQATTPTHAATTVGVTVTNPDSSSATLPLSFTYVVSKGSDPAPTIDSLSPNTGPAAGGTVVLVTGSNFASGATATLGGTSVSVTLLSGSQIQFTTPAHAPGAVPLVITNPDGQSATRLSAFTFLGAVAVTTVTPTSGPTSGGTTVSISGSGFLSGATVRFGGTLASGVSVLSSTQISGIAPAHAAGAVDVVVTNPDATSGTKSSAYTYIAPPTVSTVSPTSGTTSGGTTVTITGTGFVAGATVGFGGTPGTSVTFLSSTQLRAVTPAHAAGVVTVTVTNPDGQTGSKASGYTYAAAVTVTTVSPTSGPSVGGTTVTITGASFQSGASVSFGGTLATSVTFVSSTQLQAVTPAHADGVVSVTVTNPDASSATKTNAFTFATATTIGGVSPTSGSGLGGTFVTINGTNFQPGITVAFGGTLGTGVNRISSTQLTVFTPAHAPGTVSVTVTNPDTSTATATNAFTYNPALDITGVAPNSGTIDGGTAVDITGVSFAPGAIVIFGGTDATSVTFVSSTHLQATTPARATAATVDVQVMNPDGELATEPNAFTYILSKGSATGPEITNVSPASGPAAGGTVIIVTGNNFAPTPTVTVGGVACASPLMLSGAQVQCTTGPRAAGPADVVLTNPDGQAATAAGGYFYEGLTLISVTPGVADIAGGTVLTITGTGFQVGATVLIGGLAASFVTVDSATQITATAPAHPAGFVDVVVTNPGGLSASLASSVNYINPPRISAIEPNSGLNTGGTLITLRGAGFVAGTSITFGGIAGTSVTIISDTQLTVRTPAHSVGPVNVALTNSLGATSVTNGFRYGQVIFQDGFEACGYSAWSGFFNSLDVLIANKATPADAPFVRTGNCSSKIHYRICNVNTPAPLTGITQVAGGALGARTYFIKYTYVNSFGETLPSAEQTFAVSAGNLIRIPSPPAQVDLTQWNVYISTVTNGETKQTTTPLNVGTAFTEPATGLITGTAPPTSNAACGAAHQDRNRYFFRNFDATTGFPSNLQHFFVRAYVYIRDPEPGGSLNDVQRKLFYYKAPNTFTGGAYDWGLTLTTDAVGGKLGLYIREIVNITCSTCGNANYYGASNELGNNPAVVNGIAEVALNRWVPIELELRANDPGVANGLMRYWVDGTLVFQKTGLILRDPSFGTEGIRTIEIGRQVDRIVFATDVDEFRFWDDVVIADAYIGP